VLAVLVYFLQPSFSKSPMPLFFWFSSCGAV
jgi:hypothetical protein